MLPPRGQSHPLTLQSLLARCFSLVKMYGLFNSSDSHGQLLELAFLSCLLSLERLTPLAADLPELFVSRCAL